MAVETFSALTGAAHQLLTRTSSLVEHNIQPALTRLDEIVDEVGALSAKSSTHMMEATGADGIRRSGFTLVPDVHVEAFDAMVEAATGRVRTGVGLLRSADDGKKLLEPAQHALDALEQVPVLAQLPKVGIEDLIAARAKLDAAIPHLQLASLTHA